MKKIIILSFILIESGFILYSWQGEFLPIGILFALIYLLIGGASLYFDEDKIDRLFFISSLLIMFLRVPLNYIEIQKSQLSKSVGEIKSPALIKGNFKIADCDKLTGWALIECQKNNLRVQELSIATQQKNNSTITEINSIKESKKSESLNFESWMLLIVRLSLGLLLPSLIWGLCSIRESKQIERDPELVALDILTESCNTIEQKIIALRQYKKSDETIWNYLGLSKSTFYRKLKLMGLDRNNSETNLRLRKVK